jgi:pyruvate dehydrogenase E2 component (dihydrolipoamide acetyltransferase)
MTPAVRRLAREHGIDLAALAPASGRVSMETVQEAIKAGARKPPATQAVPLSSIRRTIAERMQKAHSAPHINLTAEVCFGRLFDLRAGWQLAPPGVVAMIAAATVRALELHPLLNSTFSDDLLTTHPDVNLGVAVARPEGLIVPVLKSANGLSVTEIASALRDLVDRTRGGGLKPEETRGGTFTISSLGERGVDHFTALVNAPQVAILAVGRISDRIVIRKRSEFSIEPAAYLTLSCDHRIVDGAPGADFLQAVKNAIEDPSWMVES